ncbi:hypothetical protein BH10PSE12_BH10PSE12_17730 [soil metagenome]
MFDARVNRRSAVGSFALAAMALSFPGRAMAVAAPVADAKLAATQALIQVAFPHRRLPATYYADVAKTYRAELAETPSGLTDLDKGLGRLDASLMAPFADLPSVIQAGLVDRIDQEPFFKALLWRTAEIIYRDPQVWKTVGYEGSSVEYGGYKERGFNDIDWLPTPEKAA